MIQQYRTIVEQAVAEGEESESRPDGHPDELIFPEEVCCTYRSTLYSLTGRQKILPLASRSKSMESSDGSRGRGRRSKVVRLLETYDLQGLGAELEQLWTADQDRKSLRELAAYFNQHLVEQTLEEANVQFLDGEVANIHRLLTDDDVSSAEYTRVCRQLERDDIDVDALEDDFVTYQAIRTYLKKYRGAEHTPPEANPLEREAANLQQLQGRTAAVTEGKLEQLRDNDELVLEEFRTIVTVQIVCEGCNSQFDVLELLDRGGCDCAEQ